MYLLGASGHAKVVLDILQLNKFSVKGFFDDNPDIKQFQNLSAMGRIADAQILNDDFIIAIGYNSVRKKLAEKFPLSYIKAIHPSAVLDKTVKVGAGTVVMGGVVINADTFIGEHVIVNTGAAVDHDCVVENFAHISPNSTLSGGVIVKEGAQIGAGAVVIQGITIGKWATVGAGAVVIRDVPEGATVVGNPARTIK